jgi:hypothetical protein
MLNRILKSPSQSFFLLEPRGTGKSTWLQALFPDAHFIDLLSVVTYQGLLANPGLFANQLRAIPAGGIETEVDFLLQRNREFVAVKAKSGRAFSEKWCKGLRAITDLKGLRRRIVVYPHGPVMRTDDGIDVFPFVHFAGLLAENKL